MAFKLSESGRAQLETLRPRYPNSRALCIPLLALCQEEAGWISPDVVDFVAGELDLSTSAVKGVATFYTSLFKQPVAPNVVWVCRTLSCELRGAKLIQEHLESRFGCHVGESSEDGRFTLLKAECLAACGQGPMVQINDRYYENLTLDKLDGILDELAAKTPEGPRPAKVTIDHDVSVSDLNRGAAQQTPST